MGRGPAGGRDGQNVRNPLVTTTAMVMKTIATRFAKLD